MKISSDYYVLGLISLLAILLRMIIIPLYGNGLDGNPVDVYYVDREAAQLVLAFQDPYVNSTFTNHLGQIVTFAYLPLVPIFYAPFALLGLDIRYGSIVADVVILASMYFIARSALGEKQFAWMRFTGSFVYAILPVSIILTSISGTNMMIASMFLIASLAALFHDKGVVSGIFLGLAVATSQFMILILPIFAIYYIRHHDLKPVTASLIVAGAIVLPFALYSPSNFLKDVVFYQFQRPMQGNGYWSLYYVSYSLTGLNLGTAIRFAFFLVPASLASFFLSFEKKIMLAGMTIVLSLSAFILPIDGFWNYYLLPITVVCAGLPMLLADYVIIPLSKRGSSPALESRNH